MVQVGVEVLLHDKEAYGECLQLYKQLFAKQKKFVSSIQFYMYVCMCVMYAVLCVYMCSVCSMCVCVYMCAIQCTHTLQGIERYCTFLLQ